MKINISNIQRMYSAVLLPIRAQISSEFWYCVLELVKYPDVPIMRLKMDWRQQRKWTRSKDKIFNVYWTDEMDTNRRQCVKKIADSIRNKPTTVRELEANFNPGITSSNLDSLVVRRVYNSVYPRQNKPRNPRGHTRIQRLHIDSSFSHIMDKTGLSSTMFLLCLLTRSHNVYRNTCISMEQS
jgi:hypothetical protein